MSSDIKAGLGLRFVQFLQERFPLTSHLPWILCFYCANVAVGLSGQALDARQFSCGLIVVLLFFLRLRLFDEIKDLDYDRKYNAERPLVRGLLSEREVKQIITFVLFIEIILTIIVAPQALGFYLLAMLYSLLMFKEFFIGSIIRPYLTTYAIMHTVVAAFLGLLVMAFTNGAIFSGDYKTGIVFGLINWALFNIFEFSRKTFALQEERQGVDSYSSLFGRFGAVALTLSQVVLLLAVLFVMSFKQFSDFVLLTQLILALILLLAGIFYLFVGTLKSAKVYRLVAGLYLLLVYSSFASILLN